MTTWMWVVLLAWVVVSVVLALFIGRALRHADRRERASTIAEVLPMRPVEGAGGTPDGPDLPDGPGGPEHHPRRLAS